MDIKFYSSLDNSRLDAAILKSTQKVGNFVKSVTDFGNTLETQFQRAAIRLTAYVGIFQAINLGKQIVEVTGQFQQLSIAFETMLDSKSKADQIMSESIALAQKTPFTLMDVTTNAKQLMAMGVSFEKVMETVKNLGDVAAGVSVPLSRIAINYGQVLTLGKLQQREIRDFAMAGVPLVSELAKNLGKTTDEITGMVSAGKIGAKEVEQAFQTMAGEGGRFYNLMEKQNKSITGQVSNLVDKWQVMMNDLGASNSGFIYGTIEGLGTLMANYKEIITIIQDLIVVYGSYKAALIAVNSLQIAQRTTALIEEGKVINQILTLEQAEILSKKKLIEGTAAYTIASKNELTAELAKQTALSASLGKEIVKREAVIATKEADIVATNLKMTAQAKELALALKFNDQAKINIATQNLQTTGKELQTLTTEKNTLSTGLNTLQQKANNVSVRVNTIETGLNTGAQAANTASLNLLTIAKARGAVIAAKYNAVLAANPYLIWIAVITAATFAVYKIITAETQAEKAEKKLQETIKKTNEERKRISDEGNELTNVIRSQTASVYEQVEAFNELIKKYDFFKKYSIEEIQAMTAEQWKSVMQEFNIAVSKELPQANYDKQLALVVSLGNQIDEVNKKIKEGGDSQILTSQLTRLNNDLIIAKSNLIGYSKELDKVKKSELETRLLSLPKSEQEEYHKKVLENLRTEKKAREDSLTIEKGKAVPNVVTIASGGLALDDLNKRIKKEENILATFRTSDIVKNRAYWEKIRDDAQAAMDVMFPGQEGWDEQKKLRDNAQKQLEIWSKTKADTETKAEKASKKLEEERTNFILNNELKFQNDLLDIEDKTKTQQLALAENTYKKSLADAEEFKNKRLKLLSEEAGKKVTDLSGIDLEQYNQQIEEAASIRTKTVVKIESDSQEEIRKIMAESEEAFLSQTEREEDAINDKYDKWRENLIKNNASGFEFLKLEERRAEELDLIHLDNSLKMSKYYQKAFSDLSDYGYSTLKNLAQETKAMIDSASEIDIKGEKGYLITEKAFGANGEEITKDSKISAEAYNSLIKKYKELVDLYEEKNPFEMLATDFKNLSNALEGNGNVGDALTKLNKDLGSVKDQVYGLIESFNFDEATEDVMKAATNMTTGVITMINSIKVLSSSAAKEMKTIEKASIILTIIQAAYSAISAIFASHQKAEEKRLAWLKEELETQLKINSALNEQLRIQEDSSVFITDYAKKIYNASEALADAEKRFSDVLKTELSVPTWYGNTKKYAQDLKEYLTLLQVQVGTVTRSVAIFWQKTKPVYGSLLENYKDLIDANGELNISVAESILEMENLPEQTRKSLEQLVEYQKEIEAAQQAMADAVLSIAGQISTDLYGSLRDAWSAGTDSFTAFKNSVSEGLEEIISQMAFNAIFQDVFTQLQEDMKESFGLTGDQLVTDDIAKLLSAAPELISAWEKAMSESESAAKAAGFDFGKTTSKTGLAGQISESITEDTGRELSGLFRSFRDDARITRDSAKIGVNHLASIERNTAETVNRLDLAVTELKSINKNTKEPYVNL